RDLHSFPTRRSSDLTHTHTHTHTHTVALTTVIHAHTLTCTAGILRLDNNQTHTHTHTHTHTQTHTPTHTHTHTPYIPDSSDHHMQHTHREHSGKRPEPLCWDQIKSPSDGSNRTHSTVKIRIVCKSEPELCIQSFP